MYIAPVNLNKSEMNLKRERVTIAKHGGGSQWPQSRSSCSFSAEMKGGIWYIPADLSVFVKRIVQISQQLHCHIPTKNVVHGALQSFRICFTLLKNISDGWFSGIRKDPPTARPSKISHGFLHYDKPSKSPSHQMPHMPAEPWSWRRTWHPASSVRFATFFHERSRLF